MARKTGAATKAAFAIASTFGTAVALGADDGFDADSITHSTNPTELSREGIGSGLSMQTDAVQGALAPGGNISFVPSYENGMTAFMAAFFGQANAPVEQTATEGDYLHQFAFAESPLRFGTLAFEATDTREIEYTSVYPTQLQFTAEDIPNFLQVSGDWVSGERDLASVTNADLSGVTITDTESVTVKNESEFQINVQSAGALGVSDRVCIASYDLTLARPKEQLSEICGVAGLSEPIADGLFTAELTVEFSGLDDFTWYDAADNETEYKALLQVEGTQIGAGLNKTFAIYLPRLKVVQDPTYDLEDPGVNPHTVTFTGLAATAAPTGMDFALPYVEVINTRSTAYLP
jgi:hypothetical protein